jgi:hypothetical protein
VWMQPLDVCRAKLKEFFRNTLLDSSLLGWIMGLMTEKV